MSSLCTYEFIYEQGFNERCSYVQNNCEYEYINFYSMHFCLFQSNLLLTIPTIICLFALFFIIISSASNSFLSASLTKIVEILKISQNLAGVTLIAFGNGAGDVLSSIVAANGKEGIELALGSLLGTGMLLTSFVFGLILYYGKAIKVNKSMFNRDLILFLFALLVLVGFAINKKIELYQSLAFISLYLLNVAIAFYQDWQAKKHVRLETIEQMNLPAALDSNNHNDRNDIEYNNQKEFNIPVINELSENTLSTHSNTVRSSISEQIANDIKRSTLINNDEQQEDSDNNPLDSKKVSMLSVNNNLQYLKNRVRKHYSKYKEQDWEETSCFKCPFTSISSLTIPPCEEKHWNRSKVIMMPLSIFIFILIVFKFYDNYMDNISFIILGFAFAILFTSLLCFIPSGFPEKRMMVLSLLCLAMSLLWIWFIVNNLISLIQMIGLIFRLPDAFLGLTILAFGNSVCDLSLNISLVKGGYGEMALTSSIAGPLLNLLIGLGICLVKMNILFGDIPFNIYTKENLLTTVSILFLFINLIMMIIQAKCLNYTLNKTMGIIGFGMYALFFITICIITFVFN